jgi:hypothetical protein
MGYTWREMKREKPDDPPVRQSVAGAFTLQVDARRGEDGKFAGCLASVFAGRHPFLTLHAEPLAGNAEDDSLERTLRHAQAMCEINLLLALFGGLAPADKSSYERLELWRREVSSPEGIAKITEAVRRIGEAVDAARAPAMELMSDGG